MCDQIAHGLQITAEFGCDLSLQLGLNRQFGKGPCVALVGLFKGDEEVGIPGLGITPLRALKPAVQHAEPGIANGIGVVLNGGGGGPQFAGEAGVL